MIFFIVKEKKELHGQERTKGIAPRDMTKKKVLSFSASLMCD